MSSNVSTASLTSPDKNFVSPRPTPAKAALRDNVGQERLSDVVIEAAKSAYGKQGAAAAQLGKDEGNFSRDTKARRLTLAHLEELGPPFLAELGRELLKEYGTALESPEDRARRLIEEARKSLDELEGYVRFKEHVA